VESVAEVVAPAVPAHLGIRIGESDPVILWVAYAPSLNEGDVEDPGQLSDTSDPFHPHDYEGSEEAEGVAEWSAGAWGVEGLLCLCFGKV